MTSVTCECGDDDCDLADGGYDEVTQFLIEEACMTRLRHAQRMEERDNLSTLAGITGPGAPSEVEAFQGPLADLPVPVWEDPAAQEARQWAASRGSGG